MNSDLNNQKNKESKNELDKMKKNIEKISKENLEDPIAKDVDLKETTDIVLDKIDEDFKDIKKDDEKAKKKKTDQKKDEEKFIHPPLKVYKHAKHGVKVKSCNYVPGMEDGWYNEILKSYKKKKDNEKHCKPYMIIDKNGLKQRLVVSGTDYIVYHKGYRFLFPKEFFEKNYFEIGNN